MTHNDETLPAPVEADPIPNPGLPPHEYRPTDVDERAAKRAERQVAGFFGASMVFAVLFVVSYFAFEVGEDWDTIFGWGASTVTLGTTLGLALLLIGVGVIQWARKLMSDHEMVEERHAISSSDDDRQDMLTALRAGLDESGIGRRPLVRNSLLGAVAMLGLPAVVLLRDLGPNPWADEVSDAETGKGLEHTLWSEGMRVTRDTLGTPIRPQDLEVGDLVNCQPEALYAVDDQGNRIVEGVDEYVAKSKASVVLLRMDPDDIIHGRGRENWTVEGIVAYSKICTHVGCPVALYERQTHHVLCPCHQIGRAHV